MSNPLNIQVREIRQIPGSSGIMVFCSVELKATGESLVLADLPRAEHARFLERVQAKIAGSLPHDADVDPERAILGAVKSQVESLRRERDLLVEDVDRLTAEKALTAVAKSDGDPSGSLSARADAGAKSDGGGAEIR